MKENWMLIGLLFFASSLNAQTWDRRVNGTILRSRGEAAENCLVVI